MSCLFFDLVTKGKNAVFGKYLICIDFVQISPRPAIVRAMFMPIEHKYRRWDRDANTAAAGLLHRKATLRFVWTFAAIPAA